MEWSFTDKSNWTGPYFELMFELGPHPDSVGKTRRALELLWQHPTLEGPYESDCVPIAQQRKAAIVHEDSAELVHLYGMATWPNGNRSPCGAVPVIPEAAVSPVSDEVHQHIRYGENPLEPGPDELIFYLPSLYGEPTAIDWWGEIDQTLDAALRDWLSNLAEHVFSGVPFELATIGPEGLWDLERGDSGDAPVPGVTVLRADPEGRALRRLDAAE